MKIWANEVQARVDALAKELNCRLVQRENMPGMMYVEFGYIEGPIIRNVSDYLIMLHELGHVAYGHTQGRPPEDSKRFYFDNGVLHSEAQAWEWALNKYDAADMWSWAATGTAEPIPRTTRKFMWDTCLGSYYKNGYLTHKGKPDRLLNGNRHYVQFVYDHPDEYFESVMRRIKGFCPEDFFDVKYVGRFVPDEPWRAE